MQTVTSLFPSIVTSIWTGFFTSMTLILAR